MFLLFLVEVLCLRRVADCKMIIKDDLNVWISKSFSLPRAYDDYLYLISTFFYICLEICTAETETFDSNILKLSLVLKVCIFANIESH